VKLWLNVTVFTPLWLLQDNAYVAPPSLIVFMKRITVLLADDHAVVREGLRMLLEAEDDLEVVGEAQNGRQAVELTRKLRPAVVVMDIAMPLLNGLEATRQICKAFPDTKVLMLSAHSDDAYIDQAVAIGAAGYLLKQDSSDNLSKAIREVQKGNTFFSPSISTRLHDQKVSAREGALQKKVAHLSLRQMEVLQLIAEGKTNNETAEELGIRIKTVEKHRQSLMAKLNIHGISGLTRYAIGAGIIESSVQLTIR
jgi:DNA-binding NarL/FixJ family response regulator